MKRIIGLGLVLAFCLALSACSNDSNNTNNENSSASSTIESSSLDSSVSSEAKDDAAVSIDIYAPGDYLVGTDIEPGSYYAVLTEMNYSEDDTEQEAYTTISVVSGEDSSFDSFSKIGEKKRYILKDGDTVTIDDNYSPTWTIQLLNETDFRDYMEDSK